MKKVFETREFSQYRVLSLRESRQEIFDSAISFAEKKPTVFLSHKHEDLDDLKDIIGFLEKKYNVSVYIDSNDPTMPTLTSGETAQKLKSRIKKCDKFILLATNGAVESKWCNWELGYGDAYKYQGSIALFPIKPKGSADSQYKGKEYLQIYPSIAYHSSVDDQTKTTGYYVRIPKASGKVMFVPLESWLKGET